MELLDYVTDMTHRVWLSNSTPAADTIQKDCEFYHNLVQLCSDQLSRFEGRDPDKEEASTKRTPGKKKMNTVNAVARRMKLYKQRIALTVEGDATRNADVALMDLDELEKKEKKAREDNAPGTPDGNHSIRNLFALKKAPDNNSTV